MQFMVNGLRQDASGLEQTGGFPTASAIYLSCGRLQVQRVGKQTVMGFSPLNKTMASLDQYKQYFSKKASVQTADSFGEKVVHLWL